MLISRACLSDDNIPRIDRHTHLDTFFFLGGGVLISTEALLCDDGLFV